MYSFNSFRKVIDTRISDVWNLNIFGDVHRDVVSCDVDRWKWFLERMKKMDQKKSLYICMGDTHDFLSVSECKKINAANLHETTMENFDLKVRKEIAAFEKEIGFMKPGLLGFIQGNHDWKFANGKYATEVMAEDMGVPALGWLTYYRVVFNFVERPKSSMAVDIVACHGKAGGKTAGITITQVDDLRRIFPAADVYIHGHDHQRGAWPIDSLFAIDGNAIFKMKQKRQWLCRSGSFVKAYEEGKNSYEIARLLKPSDLGAIRLSISFHRERKHGNDIIKLDIESHV